MLWDMCDVLYEKVARNSKGMNVRGFFYGGASIFSLLEFGLFPFTASHRFFVTAR